MEDGAATKEQEQAVEPASARFSRALNDYAERITSVRNDVYTTKWWQFVINFVLGGGALAMLIVSMFTKGLTMSLCAIFGVVSVVGLLVYNYVLHSVTPTSFLQYTYIDKAKSRRLKFLVLSKKRAAYFDGTHTIESNRDEAALMDGPIFEQYRFDFFADMQPTERIVSGMREQYNGILTHDGKKYKCKIVFDNGVPLYGSIGGVRIKYFDVNKTKEKFVVPVTLKRAAKALNVEFPKVPGLYIKDDVKDYTKQ